MITPIITKYEKHFKEIIENKDIIVVGPSIKLQNLKQGTFIDSKDVVIRMNQGFKITPEQYSDYGSKTDILYHCLHQNSKYSLKEFENANIKQIALHVNNFHNRTCENNFNRFKKLTKNQIPYHIFDIKLYRKTLASLKTPTTGVRAIVDLLSYNINSLYIIGMDFHKSGYFKGYNNKSEKDVAHEHKILEKKGIHRFDVQAGFVKYIIKKDKRVSCDDIMNNVIKNVQIPKPVSNFYENNLKQYQQIP